MWTQRCRKWKHIPADRLSENGNSNQSAIDHTYYSQEIKDRVLTSKLEISNADHVPIKGSPIKIIMLDKATNKVKQSKKKVKRSMKHFNQTNTLTAAKRANSEYCRELPI